MNPSHPTFAPAFLALALSAAAGAWAQTTPVAPAAPTAATGTVATTQPAPAPASVPTDKLVSAFTPLAGSPENAASLVNGLRTGSPITLAGTAAGAPGGLPAGEAVSFTAPTKPMGYGNIRIALSLAEAQLAGQGVTNPTPTQLQGALMGATTTGPGGTTTSSQGILQMRAAGMGWGRIAHASGFKLGPVMSGKQTFTPAPVAGGSVTAAGTGAAGGTAGHGKSSLTTAAGAAAPGRSGVTTAGGGNAGGHGKSSVVTAGGGGGGQVTTGLGQGHGAGASSGVVSAAGGKGGGQGAVHGKGGGKP